MIMTIIDIPYTTKVLEDTPGVIVLHNKDPCIGKLKKDSSRFAEAGDFEDTCLGALVLRWRIMFGGLTFKALAPHQVAPHLAQAGVEWIAQRQISNDNCAERLADELQV
eukprot:1516234-Amphidinium_carterae.2